MLGVVDPARLLARRQSGLSASNARDQSVRQFALHRSGCREYLGSRTTGDNGPEVASVTWVTYPGDQGVPPIGDVGESSRHLGT